MGRHSTFPDLVEDCITLNISDLKKWGYLENNRIVSGTISTSRGGEVIASWNISSTMQEQSGIVKLSYSTNGELITYPVELISMPTNIGKGIRWYFICPSTGKRAMKLYKGYSSKYFQHREAYNMYYKSQLLSRIVRQWDKSSFGIGCKLDNLYEEFYKKYRKKYYKGKPTKAYQKILDLQAKYRYAPKLEFLYYNK